MSRRNRKTGSITLRVSDQFRELASDVVENKKLAKNMTDLVEQAVEEFSKKGTDESLEIDPDVIMMIDEFRAQNVPPSPRSLILNWALREFFQKNKR